MTNANLPISGGDCDVWPCMMAALLPHAVPVAGTIHESTTRLPKTQSAWWTLGLGLLALVVGPVSGFGLVGLFLAIATFVAGITAYRHGERSWILWLGMALAVATVCYLPFMSSDYPYTNQ